MGLPLGAPRLLRAHVKPSHRRALLRVLALLPLVLLPALLASVRARSTPPFGGRAARLSRWPLPPCLAGRWASAPSPYSPARFPYAILRDAVVDRRPLARARRPLPDPPGAVRILLYLTTHLSARHTRESSIVTTTHPDLQGTVEYVTQADRETLPDVRHYAKGMTTKYGQQVSEWHVAVLLYPKPSANVHAVQRALESNAQLSLTLRVVRFFDNSTHGIPLHLSLPLPCVLGWHTPGLERRRPVCDDTPQNPPDGAVALLSKPLHTNRKRDPHYFYEVAHWATRALFGPVRFDAVVVPVVVDASVSEMDFNCEGAHESCRQDLLDVNQGMLERIANAVETEFKRMAIPSADFSRVMLVPTCRLGSHANGTEKEDPCSASTGYGQFYTAFSTYAMIAPYFKVTSLHNNTIQNTPRVRPLFSNLLKLTLPSAYHTNNLVAQN